MPGKVAFEPNRGNGVMFLSHVLRHGKIGGTTEDRSFVLRDERAFIVLGGFYDAGDGEYDSESVRSEVV